MTARGASATAAGTGGVTAVTAVTDAVIAGTGAPAAAGRGATAARIDPASGGADPAAGGADDLPVGTGKPAADRDEVAERRARAVWSGLAEPGELASGELLDGFGAVGALTWLRSLARGRPSWEVLDEGRPWSTGTRERLARRGQVWAARLDRAQRAAEAGIEAGWTVLVPGDPGWPPGLDDLAAEAPPCLWARGTPTAAGGPAVAMVGARACTGYGQRVAGDLAAGLTTAGLTVVSGGAYGIDAAAHRGALSAGPTVVVLAGGLDRAYPVGNVALFEACVGVGGVLLSEAPAGTVPARSRFLQRNRLIAALGTGAVVVEAAWRSGALSTAMHAARLLRPVGAVPGPVTSAASAGCHRLIREGVATCVTGADEVLELVGPLGTTPVREQSPARALDGVDADARAVHDVLDVHVPLTTAEVVAHSGLALAQVRGALGRLTTEGLALRAGDGWCALRPPRARR